MKFELSREWCRESAQIEGDAEIGAGVLARTPNERRPAPTSSDDDLVQMAFGRFVSLQRRELVLSIQELANRANVDVEELLLIEQSSHHKAEPRAVNELAKLFKLPSKKMLQLSGNTVARNDNLRATAVRFAAKSLNIEKLSREERQALNEFVRELSRQDEARESP